MYPITFTVHNEAQLNAVLKALGGNAVAPAPTTEKPPKPTAAPASSGSGAAPQSTAPKADAPATATGHEAKTYTIDDAKTLTTQVVKAGKRTDMVALLKEFGVEQAAKLPADKVAPFCTKAEELLK